MTTNQFEKHDQGKPDLSLLPTLAIEDVARVMMYGAEKYARDNWRQCGEPMRLMSAALRHLFAYQRGEVSDSESGLHHLAHAATCVLMVLELEEEGQAGREEGTGHATRGTE